MNARDPKPRAGLLRRFLRGCAAVPIALWVVLEEWLWAGLLACMGWLGRLPPVRWVENRIRRLGPYPAMAVFLLPWLLLLPVKLIGIWLIGTGHVKTGVLFFFGAKVVGTAVLARLFSLTKTALLSIGWFRRLYEWFMRWRDRLYSFVRSLRAWQIAKAFARRVKVIARHWYRVLLRR
jgi:hypothetical protein